MAAGLAADGTSVDPTMHRVRRADDGVSVTPCEFTLPEFLIRHPDEVMSKTQILTNVWDEFYEDDPNVVEVYIGYLRRKIDAPSGHASIQTVCGVGYRLHADGR